MKYHSLINCYHPELVEGSPLFDFEYSINLSQSPLISASFFLLVHPFIYLSLKNASWRVGISQEKTNFTGNLLDVNPSKAPAICSAILFSKSTAEPV